MWEISHKGTGRNIIGTCFVGQEGGGGGGGGGEGCVRGGGAKELHSLFVSINVHNKEGQPGRGGGLHADYGHWGDEKRTASKMGGRCPFDSLSRLFETSPILFVGLWGGGERSMRFCIACIALHFIALLCVAKRCAREGLGGGGVWGRCREVRGPWQSDDIVTSVTIRTKNTPDNGGDKKDDVKGVLVGRGSKLVVGGGGVGVLFFVFFGINSWCVRYHNKVVCSCFLWLCVCDVPMPSDTGSSSNTRRVQHQCVLQ